MHKKLLVVDIAALGWDFVRTHPVHDGLSFQRAETVFPAVTCTVQATFRTAALPRQHGLVANGLFFPELRKVMFWEQAAALVSGERVWRRLRERGRKAGMMFWQQSLGEDLDLVLSPRPIHKHEGGMIQDCYSQPHDLYRDLSEKIGRTFNLMHYWGPLASRKSSDWIAEAVAAVMDSAAHAPDLLFAYLPHMDYDLLRYGPESSAARRALAHLHSLLARLVKACERNGWDYLFFGDYAMQQVSKPAVLPNLALRRAGLFQVRSLKGMAYPDFFASPAFALVDHEMAHVFTRNEEAKRKARQALESLPGISAIFDRAQQAEFGLDHARSGDLVLLAEKGAWCAYPWWTDRKEAPDFATHVDIHNKPGFDPCELFFGWPPLTVSLDTAKVGGTHGRAGPDAAVAWTSSLKFDFQPASLLDLSRAVRDWCERG